MLDVGEYQVVQGASVASESFVWGWGGAWGGDTPLCVLWESGGHSPQSSSPGPWGSPGSRPGSRLAPPHGRGPCTLQPPLLCPAHLQTAAAVAHQPAQLGQAASGRGVVRGGGPVVGPLVAGQLGSLHQEPDAGQVASPGGVVHQASPQGISDMRAQGARLQQLLQGGQIPVLGGRERPLLLHPPPWPPSRLSEAHTGPGFLFQDGTQLAAPVTDKRAQGRWEAVGVGGDRPWGPGLAALPQPLPGHPEQGKGPHQVWVGGGHCPVAGPCLPLTWIEGWDGLPTLSGYSQLVSFPGSSQLLRVCFLRAGDSLRTLWWAVQRPLRRPSSREGRPIQAKPFLSIWAVSAMGTQACCPLGTLSWSLALAGTGGFTHCWAAVALQTSDGHRAWHWTGRPLRGG